MKAARDHLVLCLCVGLLGLICLGWSCVALPLHAVTPARLGTRIGRRVIMRGLRFYAWVLEASGAYRLDLSALDALREDPRLIIAPNHPCLIDALLILTRHPNVVCVMKAELMSNVFLGASARLARYVRNSSTRRMVRDSVAHLERGCALLLFPEGTRSTRAPVNRFTASVGLIARHAGVAVQTVLIETDSPYLSKGWSLFRRPTLPISYRVRLGRRFDPSEDVAGWVAGLEAHFRRELTDAWQSHWLER